jgi:hypothetical protein
MIAWLFPDVFWSRGRAFPLCFARSNGNEQKPVPVGSAEQTERVFSYPRQGFLDQHSVKPTTQDLGVGDGCECLIELVVERFVFK